jgi:hypothetical protein
MLNTQNRGKYCSRKHKFLNKSYKDYLRKKLLSKFMNINFFEL